MMQIINPATGKVVREVETDTKASLENKLNTLQEARSSWASVSLKDRMAVIERFHALLADEIETLAAELTLEVGKPLQQSRNEVNGARTRIAWMLQNAERYLSDEVMSDDGSMEERIKYEPLGVICNISAWNYPWLVGVNVVIPALLAGNAIMYKPSEYSTLTGMHMRRLLVSAGLPAEVMQTAIGAGDIGEALLHMPFDGYFFTGSYRTGQHIYETVAPRMVVCQLELGGKDPLYVTDDVADIAAVAAGTADGAFYNNGQSCCAVERIYVHEKVYDEYVDAFVKEVRSWKMGDPTEDGVYLGPLTRSANINLLTHQIQDAISKGAVLQTGGQLIDGPGYFFAPAVLTNVDHTMEIMKEESFGPVIGIMKVKDDAEALKLMNDTSYGLTASVYTSNPARGEQILAKVDSGTGYVNCCDRVSAALPWSGRRHSGFGATLSHQGLRAFTKPKGMHVRKSS
jgi:acyl-CoA reductase-like NAD-dependent aldehyde dehydrogenase